MVSLPVAPGDADPARLGFVGSSWSRWNPQTGAYVGYDADPGHYTWFDDAATVPGKGYWARFAANTSVAVEGVRTPDGDYAIPVNPGTGGGWVQIGCPSDAQLPWRAATAQGIRVRVDGDVKTLDGARKAGWCEDFAWGYWPDNGYELIYDQSNSPVGNKGYLEPGRGYWFLAYRACELLIPTVGAAPELAQQSADAPSDGQWQMVLSASASGQSSSVTIGRADAARGIQAPPAATSGAWLHALSGNRRCAVDLRAAGEGATWEFAAGAPGTGEEVTIAWPDLSAVPADLRPVLVDRATGTRVSMRTSAAYRFRSSGGDTERRIAVELRSAQEPGLAIVGLAATPARDGRIDLRVSLSAGAVVDAEVLNIAGRPVATICSGRACEPGIETLTWSGRSSTGTTVPAGRYLLRLTARAIDGQQVTGLAPATVRR